MTSRFRFSGSVWSVLFMVVLGAACSSEDSADSGANPNCAKEPTCYEQCTCRKTPASTCLTQCGGTGLCGNGTLDEGEQCDGALLNGETCATATSGANPIGQVSCSNCQLVVTGCTGSAGGSTGTGGGGGISGGGGLGGSGGFGGGI